MKNNFDPKKHKIFEPLNSKKYKGKHPIVCRSSWEFFFFFFARWCDQNERILAWGSEDLAVHYFDPVKGRNRRYYPDFIIQVLDRNDKKKIYMVEIKPRKETIKPVPKKNYKTTLKESNTWKTNIAKWQAASAYCKQKGWEFKIITERHLFGRR